MKSILALVFLRLTLGTDEFLKKKDISVKVLQQGWADSSQQQMLLKYAKDCFSWNPVDTSHGLGGLQGSLGDAISCVLINVEQRWGWKPELLGEGSDNGGPYDGFGPGTTIIGVDSPQGKWQFILQKTGSNQDGSSTDSQSSSSSSSNQGGSSTNTEAIESVAVHCLHRGDATPEQETDLIHFTEDCFGKNRIDISNVGSLDFSMGAATACVLQKCQEKWGWKPRLSVSGSNTGGPYDAYGLGATVIGADTSTGKWDFVLNLKY